ncbi:hypothetical protein [Haloarcula salina]|uniref:Uncharacterized protein n=1 Tax=Haloarcula salina TaxID=1429914 RepID=A0AA41GBM9_9EURY|nr:hypothetical protein [Haloarcula salina]MBV0903772.1 hypothetical protein [Haloarcula salina]
MTRHIDSLGNRGRAVARRVFGDRYGVALWLGLLVAVSLYWRVGIFIADTYTTANTLAAVADGHLNIVETPYSLTLGSQPGLHHVGGELYGRNYGQVALAVPLVWTFRALSVVAAPRLLLLGLWSGLALAFVSQIGTLGNRHTGASRRAILLGGSAVVAALFLVGVSSATALSDSALALAAFQFSTMLAAATTGLVLYRLVGLWHGRPVALATGVAVGLASSVGFWASLPKRHVLVAALLLTTVYAFARSRIAYRDDRFRRALAFRAAAYLTASLVTWTHAFEGFFLVATLGVVDLATARRNALSDLLVVGCALLVGSLPMLLTNYLISGNPAKPPRLLPRVDGANAEFVPDTTFSDAGASGGSDAGTGGSDGSGGSGGTGSDGSSGSETGGDSSAGDTGAASSDGIGDVPVLGSLLAVVDRIGDVIGPAMAFVPAALLGGFESLTDLDRMSHVFLRSGHIPSVRYHLNGYAIIELTMLESVPVLGALAAAPIHGVRLLRRRASDLGHLPSQYSPRAQTDLFVAALAVVFTVIYLERLPLYSQLTVRYLLPTVPLLLYGVARLPAVNGAARDATRWLVGGYAASTLGGIALCLAAVAGLDLALGEAVQFHALLNLAGAAVCAAVVVGGTVAPDRVPSRVVAVGVALPAGLTTAFVALSGLSYFQYGPHALDVVRIAVEYLPAV